MSKVVLKKIGRTNASNPTLDTIRMIEQVLSKSLQYTSKNKLWRALPRQVQYPTFKAVLDYLEESNKIMYDRDGSIIWTFADNPKLKKLLKSSRSLL
ncbi:MAG: hypothetical protein KGH88_05680 [Thaumarchaeota archaeon]|nr:hypothetical protein [Nitrososphaerota archaeon]